ncbi:MAG: metallophosphoesterase [Melioribacteraceae bacterium]|jgi:predicted phosphodiesterase|nr:metallophosphoesterase [Melioribacteraceae bacterium]
MKIAFISDIHEDYKSLQKALKLISEENCDHIICLGDIIGFALPFYRYIDDRDANICIKLIKENCTTAVIGNHDLFGIKKIPEFKSGFNYEEDWYDKDYNYRSKKAQNRIWLYEDNEIKVKLNDASKDYLSTLKEVQFFEAGELRLMVSHFCYPDFSGSAIFFPSQSFHLEKHFNFMNENLCSISFSGHGHPEGAIRVTEDKFASLKFGKHKLLNESQWIVVPCVARTTRANGILFLNTLEKEIRTVPLK